MFQELISNRTIQTSIFPAKRKKIKRMRTNSITRSPSSNKKNKVLKNIKNLFTSKNKTTKNTFKNRSSMSKKNQYKKNLKTNFNKMIITPTFRMLLSEPIQKLPKMGYPKMTFNWIIILFQRAMRVTITFFLIQKNMKDWITWNKLTKLESNFWPNPWMN